MLRHEIARQHQTMAEAPAKGLTARDRFLPLQVQFNGRTAASNPDDVGSIPTTRASLSVAQLEEHAGSTPAARANLSEAQLDERRRPKPRVPGSSPGGEASQHLALMCRSGYCRGAG